MKLVYKFLRFAGALLVGLCLLIGAVVLAGLIWLLCESVASVVHERMLTFEGTPKEGYAYWKWEFVRRQWRVIVIGVLVLAPATFGIIYAWCQYVCGFRGLAFEDERPASDEVSSSDS